jgi:hypothetical protein
MEKKLEGVEKIADAALELVNSIINIDANNNGKAELGEVFTAIIKNLQNSPQIVAAIPELKEDFKGGFDAIKAAQILEAIEARLDGLEISSKTWVFPVKQTIAVAKAALLCTQSWIVYERKTKRIDNLEVNRGE